ncbi:hypothetical protein [Acetobacter aceti]|uniref:hypothetical protein n=1 Tax=Acetobacter aceti TaxID=435 RepID=UPI0011EA5833|nr:hypothetical protein [Acetobacter aceti]
MSREEELAVITIPMNRLLHLRAPVQGAFLWAVPGCPAGRYRRNSAVPATFTALHGSSEPLPVQRAGREYQA